MMGEDPHFSNCSVAVFGLGLMGGSLAMAIEGHCCSLYGIDPHPETLSHAAQLGIFDGLDVRPSERLHQADFIILAAPVMSILTILDELPRLHTGGPIVIDLGSTKNEIVEAMAKLPERFDPIGGHPMCGKEKGTLKNASIDLFKGFPFVLSSLDRTSPRAKNIVLEMIQIIGAKALWLDPLTHDQWVAGTSHLPYIVANALSAIIPMDFAPLIGTGYRSTTRLAISSPRMMTDILSTNRENILGLLNQLQQNLEMIKNLILQEDAHDLEEMLSRNASHQEQLLKSSGDPL